MQLQATRIYGHYRWR